jgi:hypothetical protein
MCRIRRVRTRSGGYFTDTLTELTIHFVQSDVHASSVGYYVSVGSS